MDSEAMRATAVADLRAFLPAISLQYMASLDADDCAALVADAVGHDIRLCLRGHDPRNLIRSVAEGVPSGAIPSVQASTAMVPVPTGALPAPAALVPALLSPTASSTLVPQPLLAPPHLLIYLSHQGSYYMWSNRL